MAEKHIEQLANSTSLNDLLYVERILRKDPTKTRALDAVRQAIKLKQLNAKKQTKA